MNSHFLSKDKPVIVNGRTSSWFSIERGCTQGGPVSPYLFILCVEILAIVIWENVDIKGNCVNEVTVVTWKANDAQNSTNTSIQIWFMTLFVFKVAVTQVMIFSLKRYIVGCKYWYSIKIILLQLWHGNGPVVTWKLFSCHMETKIITFLIKYAFFYWEIFESNNSLKYIANQIIKDPFYV